jgi:hypothetical protein
MKKLVLSVLAVMLMAPNIWALTPGSCVESVTSYTGGAIIVQLACTGSPDDGAIPDTEISTDVMAIVEGTHYLYTVSAYPTSGGTAPDPADVFILDENGNDLLGSVDGGTTANKGLNLINATLKKTSMPYSDYLNMAYFPLVVNALTLRVSNQATVDADYTIELVFVR